jgi:hypothetical protein
LNILIYNAGSNKDLLYGVESPLYYIKNLVLNLGVCAVLAVFGFIAKIAQWIVTVRKLNTLDLKFIGIFVSAFLWLGILFSRDHKV